MVIQFKTTIHKKNNSSYSNGIGSISLSVKVFIILPPSRVYLFSINFFSSNKFIHHFFLARLDECCKFYYFWFDYLLMYPLTPPLPPPPHRLPYCFNACWEETFPYWFSFHLNWRNNERPACRRQTLSHSNFSLIKLNSMMWWRKHNKRIKSDSSNSRLTFKFTLEECNWQCRIY